MTEKQLRWRLADLIDYEFLLAADDNHGSAELDRRDHALYRDEIAPVLQSTPSGNPERRAVLRYWLCARRRLRQPEDATLKEGVLPGEAFGEVMTEATLVLAFGSAGIGWWMAKAALEYSAGSEPINAFAFFVEFGATQMVVLAVAMMVFAVRWWLPQWRFPSLLRFGLRAASRAATAILQWLQERNPERWLKARAMRGVLRARHSLYRPVLVWSMVGFAQVLVISFNGGVLGAMTARHLFHDLDFGWESTWLDAGEVAQGVRLIALPWAWAVHPGYPNPPQVAGSQNHKRDNGHLDAESLKSWSQFLFGAVIFYGLLPRVLLLFLAIRKQRTILDRLGFNDGRSELLLLRMLTPTVEIPGQEPAHDLAAPVAPVSVGMRARTNEPALPRTHPSPRPEAAGPAVILDLTGLPLTPQQVIAAMQLADHSSPLVFTLGTVGPVEEGRIFSEIGQYASSAAKVFVLLPSWQPPVVDFTSSLNRMRACLEPGKLVSLVLVGEPGSDGTFEPVEQGHRQEWSEAIQARGDAYMYLNSSS